ncbi:MAG: SDR family oxidoreductase [Oceanospirillaceae bacterium]|nr:SDR family oxidoreductase [Oceanospirillaceae bacterium]
MKTVVITGVGKGFGRELFLGLSRNYKLIGITRNEDDCESLRKEIEPESTHHEIMCLDITDLGAIESKLLPVLEENKGSVYGLINNAGVRCRKGMLSLSLDEIKNVCEVNLFAPINLAKHMLPYFVSNNSGRIVNISSILSQSSLPELSAYAVSKAGLDGFTRSVTAEFASAGITCNSILPGFCKTSYYPNFLKNSELYEMTLDKTPAGRWGEASELIGVCELLLGQNGAYINGASIPVDGGWLS